jgi:hypothetical protein
MNPIVGRGMCREKASGPCTFGLHQPCQRGRHDPFAIAPGKLEELGAPWRSAAYSASRP